MNTATIEITTVDNSLEVLNELGIELNLEEILAESEAELASDISNGF